MIVIRYKGGSERFISADDLNKAFDTSEKEPLVASPTARECVVHNKVAEGLVAMDPDEWEIVQDLEPAAVKKKQETKASTKQDEAPAE